HEREDDCKAAPPDLRELVREPLLDSRAAAAVLVNRQCLALYFFGKIDRYMQMPAGEPSWDATLMLRDGLAAQFRAAVRQAFQDRSTAAITGRVRRNGDSEIVTISAQPLQHNGQRLVLASFLAEPTPKTSAAETPQEASRVDQRELRELHTSRRELEAMIR